MLFGGAGHDYLAAGGSGHILDGGAGNDTLFGGAGHSGLNFIFAAGYERDNIIGFDYAGTDVIHIRGFGLTNFTQLQAFMTQSGADTIITLNGSDILNVSGVAPGQLQANDFFFA